MEFVFTWREKKAKVMWPPLTAERYMTAGRGIYHMTFTSRASFDLSDDLNNTSETHIKCWAGHSDHSIQHDVIGWLSRGILESRLWLQHHSTTVDPLGLVVLSRFTPLCKFLCKKVLELIYMANKMIVQDRKKASANGSEMHSAVYVITREWDWIIRKSKRENVNAV